VIEAEIWNMRDHSPIQIALAPGYHTTDMYPCAPLNLQEININCKGILTKCCHLSAHTKNDDHRDEIGNLNKISLRAAYHLLVEENKQFVVDKTAHLHKGNIQDSDFFHCWYCSLYYKKVDWLKEVEGHPWAKLFWEPAIE
jgi:hypothetical protein